MSFDSWMDELVFRRMKRPPRRIIVILTILAGAYWGTCVGLGIWETL